MRSLFSSSATLALLFVALLPGSTTTSVMAQKLPACFLSMGDWGSYDIHVTSMSLNMQKIVEDPQSWGCSSVNMTLALGDNFYTAGVTSIHDPEWDKVFVNQFRKYPAFKNMPFYAMMGDHDYAATSHTVQPNFTRAQAQIDYHYEVDPLWVMPDANYTFKMPLGPHHEDGYMKVVVMNTEALYACLHTDFCFNAEHPQWIEAQLEESDNDQSIRSVILVGHHAVVCPYGGHYDPKLDGLLVPIVRRHRVSLIMTGHSHFIAWSQENSTYGGGYDQGDLWYIINGAGRGAGAYHCTWENLHNQHADPKNKMCMPFHVNVQGAFMLHRAHQDHFEHCVIDSMNGTVLQCQHAPYRAPGGPVNPPSEPTDAPFTLGTPVPPTPVPPPTPPTTAIPPVPSACTECNAAQCAADHCPPTDAYVCTSGGAKNGCSKQPWHLGDSCLSCCYSGNCPPRHGLQRLKENEKEKN